MTAALDEIKVVDLTRTLAGPFCTMMMGDMGADVIKIESMQRPDGGFNTFYGSERTDNQNFYPGEALLYWSTLYQEKQDPKLLKRFMRAFHYYRDWHLQKKNRNPAFIPWHTHAYYKV